MGIKGLDRAKNMAKGSCVSKLLKAGVTLFLYSHLEVEYDTLIKSI
jgi:hypothetical protein